MPAQRRQSCPSGAFELAGLPEQAYSARLSLQDATAELQSGARTGCASGLLRPRRCWSWSWKRRCRYASCRSRRRMPVQRKALPTRCAVRFPRLLSAAGADRPRWAAGLYAKNIRREILRAAQPQHSPERTKAPAYHGTDGFLRAGRTHGLRSASDAVCCLACTAAPRASGVVVRILGAERYHASGRRAGAALVPRHVFFWARVRAQGMRRCRFRASGLRIKALCRHGRAIITTI